MPGALGAGEEQMTEVTRQRDRLIQRFPSMRWTVHGDRILGKAPDGRWVSVDPYEDGWAVEGGHKGADAIEAIEKWVLAHPVAGLLGIMGEARVTEELKAEIGRLRGLLSAAGISWEGER
jgi:hypothetical protein